MKKLLFCIATLLTLSFAATANNLSENISLNDQRIEVIQHENVIELFDCTIEYDVEVTTPDGKTYKTKGKVTIKGDNLDCTKLAVSLVKASLEK